MRDYIKLYFIYDVGPSTEGHMNKEISISMIPEAIQYSYTQNIAVQPIIGRVTPLNRYVSGGDETYSFGLKVHNDALINKRLVDLVDDIKMLSYPIEKQGVLTYPEIYFELGELTGNCIVDTSIDWEKPIINGHYALVNITFTVRIVRTITLPIMTEIEREDGDGTRNVKIYTGLTDEEAEERRDYLISRGYDTTIQDFIVDGYDPEYRDFLTDENTRLINAKTERLSYLYDTLLKTDPQNKGLIKTIEDNLGWIKDIEYKIINDKLQVFQNGKKLSKRKYLKYLSTFEKKYFDLAADQLITLAESKNIVEGIKEILMQIEILENEVIGYAARS